MNKYAVTITVQYEETGRTDTTTRESGSMGDAMAHALIGELEGDHEQAMGVLAEAVHSVGDDEQNGPVRGIRPREPIEAFKDAGEALEWAFKQQDEEAEKNTGF